MVVNVSQFLQMLMNLMWGPKLSRGGFGEMESNLKMTLWQTHPSRGQSVFSGPRTDIHKWGLLKDASDIQVAIVSVSFEKHPQQVPSEACKNKQKKTAIAGEH